jgi:hypothetical protein
MEMIYVYGLHCNFSDRAVLTLEPSVQNLPLEEVNIWFVHPLLFCLSNLKSYSLHLICYYSDFDKGRCIDVKLTSDKIWVLKDNGLVFHNLLHPTVTV